MPCDSESAPFAPHKVKAHLCMCCTSLFTPPPVNKSMTVLKGKLIRPLDRPPERVSLVLAVLVGGTSIAQHVERSVCFARVSRDNPNV